MSSKLSVLGAVRRVLKHPGTLAFFVIGIPQGLSRSEKERAVEFGPPHVESDSDYPAMLGRSGFSEVAVLDVTSEFRATMDAWHRAWASGADQIAPLVGREEFEERQGRRRDALSCTDDGLLERLFVVAR